MFSKISVMITKKTLSFYKIFTELEADDVFVREACTSKEKTTRKVRLIAVGGDSL